MNKKLEVLVLDEVEEYIKKLSVSAQAKIAANIEIMKSGGFQSVYTKQLKQAIRELIVGQHRFIYFKKKQVLYFVHAFRKQTVKTPKNKIDNAMNIYKDII
ncbi:MAG TPA: hypothetical protein ENI66_01600 [Candidatus Yonathbacteria bacterium]|nr:hypothetical protein [Candidatus Yonathbacteria bacterium]